MASGRFTVIREGWKSSVLTLLKAREAAETLHTTALARAPAHKPATPLVIKDADLFATETGAPLRAPAPSVDNMRVGA